MSLAEWNLGGGDLRRLKLLGPLKEFWRGYHSFAGFYDNDNDRYDEAYGEFAT